jgi:hypothetical protein
MSEFTMTSNGESHTVEAKPLNIICPAPENMEPIKYENCVTLDTEVCLYHQARLSQKGVHADTWKFMQMVYKDKESKSPVFGDEKCNVEFVRKADMGVRHMLGLIDMTLKFIDMGVSFVWRCPEEGLHPKWCCELGDLSVAIMWRVQEANEKKAEAARLTMKIEDAKEITIEVSGSGWRDMTNDREIGSHSDLVEYVNKNRVKVLNDNDILFKNLFWYNGGKGLQPFVGIDNSKT